MTLRRKRRQRWNYLTRIGFTIFVAAFALRVFAWAYTFHQMSVEINKADGRAETLEVLKTQTRKLDAIEPLTQRIFWIGFALSLPFVIAGRMKSQRDKKLENGGQPAAGGYGLEDSAKPHP